MPGETTTDGAARRDHTRAAETDAPETLVSLVEAATALGLRPATVKQYILRGQLAAIRVPRGNTTRLFVTSAELERYRRASLGGQGWVNRRGPAPPAPPSPSPTQIASAHDVAARSL